MISTAVRPRSKRWFLQLLSGGCVAGAVAVGSAQTTGNAPPGGGVAPGSPGASDSATAGSATNNDQPSAPAAPSGSENVPAPPQPDTELPDATRRPATPLTPAQERRALEGLKGRSATSNVVFGRIVDIDDKRLNIRNGEKLTGLEMSPNTLIEINGQRGTLSDLNSLPADTDVRVLRDLKSPNRVSRIIIGGDEAEGTTEARGNRRRMTQTPGAPPAVLGADNPLPEDITTPDRPLATRTDGNIRSAADTATLSSTYPSLNFGFDLTASRAGVVLGPVTAGSLASTAGFIPGDTIKTINGTPVMSEADVIAALNTRQAGDRLMMEIIREGTPRKLTMTLPQAFAPATALDPEGIAVNPEERPRVVAPSLASVDARKVPAVDLGWQLDGTPEGVQLMEIQAGGSADLAKLQAGDIIDSIDGVSVTTPGAINYELHRHAAGSTFEVGIIRGGRRMVEKLSLPADFRPELPNGTVDDTVAAQNTSDMQALIEEVRALRAEVEALKRTRTE